MIHPDLVQLWPNVHPWTLSAHSSKVNHRSACKGSASGAEHKVPLGIRYPGIVDRTVWLRLFRFVEDSQA
jgi:hypothetical protein